MKNTAAKLKLISASVIWGTIGIVRKFLPMASGTLSICRGVIGAITLFLIVLIKGKRFDWKAIKKNLLVLVVSGMSIGINWIMIFEAMNTTSLAVANLCYYTSPVFIILGSCILYKEKITRKNIFCIVMALFGMSLVSGIWNSSLSSDQILGIALSVGAAVFYAAGIVFNKKLVDIDAIDKTFVQLISAAVIVLPYSIFFEKQIEFIPNPRNILLLLTMGVIHTGLAFVFTLDSVTKLDTKTVAFFTYIDPVVNVILSGLILKEDITLLIIVGAVFIIGSAVYNELKTN